MAPYLHHQVFLSTGKGGTEALHTGNEAAGVKVVVLPDGDLLAEVENVVEKTAIDQNLPDREGLGHQSPRIDLRPTDVLIRLVVATTATAMVITTAITDPTIGPVRGTPLSQIQNSPQSLKLQGATRQ